MRPAYHRRGCVSLLVPGPKSSRAAEGLNPTLGPSGHGQGAVGSPDSAQSRWWPQAILRIIPQAMLHGGSMLAQTGDLGF